MGFPTDMYPVLFTIPRIAGWTAHWVEFLKDPENNIYRPRQNYTGYPKREFQEMSSRKEGKLETDHVSSKKNIRRDASQKQK